MSSLRDWKCGFTGDQKPTWGYLWQVGLLLGLPGIISTFIEPVLMLLGDTGSARRSCFGGGWQLRCHWQPLRELVVSIVLQRW